MSETPKWTPVTVKLGDLKPWSLNPRLSTKKQAKRILASIAEFGQVQTIAIGPGGEVYDGHQRLSALLTIHGEGYQIDARKSDRALTDDERRKLVAMLHAGAVGSWDWNALSGWDAGQLGEWGFDAELLKGWNNDANNLKEMIGADNPDNEWEGMPEFENDDNLGDYLTIKIHFQDEESVRRLSGFIEQPITDKTKYIWYPKRENENLKNFRVSDES
jgi:hypothetical protein